MIAAYGSSVVRILFLWNWTDKLGKLKQIRNRLAVLTSRNKEHLAIVVHDE
jgi:hypothetical protein